MPSGPPLTGAQRRRRRALVTRAVLFGCITVGAAFTGLWWDHDRLDEAALADGPEDPEAQMENPAAQPEGDDGLAWDVVGVVVGVVVGGVWVLSLARARPPAPAAAPGGTDLPSDHSPAEVGWLLRYGRVTLADLAATMVDLTARGFVLPHRREGGLVLGQGRPADGLEGHEVLVLDWLFSGWTRQADLAERRAAIAEDPSLWSDLWIRFVAEVDGQARDDELVEHDVASLPVLAGASIGLGVVFAGVVGTAAGYESWLVCVVSGALVLSSATALARRTPAGEALARRWEAFGEALREGRALTPRALAYAVALGEDDAATTRRAASDRWPAQLVHDEVERNVVGWRDAFLTATSVRGEPSERVRALLSLRALRRRSEQRELTTTAG
jgi:hypothetical protein